ncbi:MAG: NUDIX hydrolase [Actinomycetota bacterium]
MFGSVIDDGGQILLLRRRDLDVWECPGGGVEPGEAPRAALHREVREETGIEIEIDRLTGLYLRRAGSLLVMQFFCSPLGTPTTSAEAREVAYFPVGGLPNRLVPAVRERIQDSLGGGGHPHFHTQTALGAADFVSTRT